MNFGLEKCARMCLKRGRVQSKVQIGNTLENDISSVNEMFSSHSTPSGFVPFRSILILVSVSIFQFVIRDDVGEGT
jgi:hypothetical protein